jgi:hypothetical protein
MTKRTGIWMVVAAVGCGGGSGGADGDAGGSAESGSASADDDDDDDGDGSADDTPTSGEDDDADGDDDGDSTGGSEDTDGGTVDDTGATDDGDSADDSADTSAPDCDREPCTGEPEWTRRYGNAGDNGTYEEMRAMITDAAGNTTAVVQVEDSLDLGDAGTAGAGQLLVRFDPDGDPLWFVEIGDAWVGALALDNDDDVLALSGYGSELRLRSFTAAGDLDIDESWTVTPADGGFVLAGDVAVAPDGRIAITGGVYGSIDFGGNNLSSTGSNDVYVAVLDESLDHVWSRRFGDSAEQRGSSIGFDPDGNVVLAGINNGYLDFGEGPIAAPNDYMMWLAVLGTDEGEQVWAQQFESGDNPGIPHLVFDDDGIYLTTDGAYGGVYVDFGLGSEVGWFHAARFDWDGVVQWHRPFGVEVGIHAAARDSANGLVIVGELEGQLDFGDGELVTSFSGTRDVFIAKYDAGDGALEWVRMITDDNQQANQQRGVGVGISGSGRVYAGGDFGGIFDMGLGDVVSGGGHGGTDLFLVALSP